MEIILPTQRPQYIIFYFYIKENRLYYIGTVVCYTFVNEYPSNKIYANINMNTMQAGKMWFIDE